ncbi:MAG TPA: hypothetical protein PKZ32_16355 [Candidatus Melainabacteria bacterium]|nr:hypothetical protein [Candidatus Melainabacteria bacterium]
MKDLLQRNKFVLQIKTEEKDVLAPKTLILSGKAFAAICPSRNEGRNQSKVNA